MNWLLVAIIFDYGGYTVVMEKVDTLQKCQEIAKFVTTQNELNKAVLEDNWFCSRLGEPNE